MLRALLLVASYIGLKKLLSLVKLLYFPLQLLVQQNGFFKLSALLISSLLFVLHVDLFLLNLFVQLVHFNPFLLAVLGPFGLLLSELFNLGLHLSNRILELTLGSLKIVSLSSQLSYPLCE